MGTIIKKELKSYFLSPIGYVFIGLFLVMCSIFFYLEVVSSGSLNYEYLFYSSATILTFIVPILTMRMFSEERKNGTEQLLFTSPRSITGIVLGKFIAAVLVIVITELLTLGYFAILMFFGEPQIMTALVTLLGFLLLSMSYISFGMFASSLTENQIIASVITVAFFIITWFMPSFNSVLAPFSLINMFSKFPSGVISLSEVVTFVSFTILFIIFTIMVLQRKKSTK